jgi:hypothetical protein
LKLGQIADRLASPRGTLLCLAGLWLVLVLGQVTDCFDMNSDSARYVALANSLATGRGYTIEGVFCRHYPPLFPLMLSTVSDPARHNFRPEILIVAVSGLAALLGSYWLLSERYDGRMLLVLALLVAVSPPFVRYCTRLRSDITFMFFSVVFLAATARFWKTRTPNWAMAVIAAVSLAAATLTRSAGLPFYVASGAWLMRPSLWRKGERGRALLALGSLALAAVPVVLWALRVAASPEGTVSYVEYMFTPEHAPESASLLSRLGAMISREMWSFPRQVAFAGSTIGYVGRNSLAPLWAALFLPALCLGLARRLRAPSPLEYAFCAYCLLILLWPRPQGTRLWVPVVPLMLGYIADGAMGFGRIAEEFPRAGRYRWVQGLDRFLGKIRRPAVHVITTLLLLVGLTAGLDRVRDSWAERDEAVGGVLLGSDPRDVALFLNESHDGPIVMAYDRFREVVPAVTNPHVTLLAIPEIPGVSPEALLEELADAGATHVAIETRIDNPTELGRLLHGVREELLAAPELYPVERETRYVTVFRMMPPHGRRPEAQPSAGGERGPDPEGAPDTSARRRNEGSGGPRESLLRPESDR